MKKLFLYLNLFFVVGCAQTDLSDRNDIAIIDTRGVDESVFKKDYSCLLYTSPSPRDGTKSRMPSSA